MAKPGFKRKPAGQRKPPDGRIRQSQLVTTFGPGAVLDLLDDAVIVGGLDFWRSAGDPIPEPRLRDAVAPIYAALNRNLSVDTPFRRPPAGDEQEPKEMVGIQVYEFPRWFVCQNPRCRALVKASQLNRKAGHYLHACGGAEDKEDRCVPIRFVAACRKGHIDDIDWPWWLHDQQDKCDAPQLRLDEGATGDFAEVRVTCLRCGKSRHIIELMVPERSPRCSGERPWLGREGRESCTEKQRLTVRTASNTYFSQVMSALSIPEPASLRRQIQSVWDILQAVTSKETLTAFRQIPKVKDALGDAADDEVLAAIQAQRENVEEEVPELRTAEYVQFMQQPEEKPGELPPDDPTVQFWARRLPTPKSLPAQVARVVVARRLREVEAQIGFTRLEPATRDLQGRFDLQVESAPLSLTKDWLPAVEIRGEGVFVQLDEKAVHDWETRDAVKRRTEVLLKGFERWADLNKSKMPFPGARFYLLHSLSHFLITAMSLECGYPASSIRERLYCAPHDDSTPMAAFLLSTGTTGAEGTLGGLVEESRRLGYHLRRAFDDARLCSNDPVCAQHAPTGPDERYLEGAACHGCLFIPECSCERFNQFLDRALVFPTLGLEDVAFFPKSSWRST